jgi:MoxR-like ATPase
MSELPVFNHNALKTLADRHHQTFQNLQAIEKSLQERFFGLGEPIRALSLAAACREPLLLIGPPGTAKSQLIRAFCNYLDIKVPERRVFQEPIDGTRQNNGSWKDADYFEYLLTPFTEPGELFGYYDIIALRDYGAYERKADGMIQQAKVVYLDEVFNASSAILNSMLALLNEGRFHDRNNIVEARWRLVLGATNHLPDTDALRAVFDRFLLRCQVDNVDIKHGHEDMQSLLQIGWKETYGLRTAGALGSYPTLLDDLEKFRSDAGSLVQSGNLKMQSDSHFYKSLLLIVNVARSRYRLSDMSNRRLIKFMFVMMVNAIYRYVATGKTHELVLGEEELHLLRRFGLDRRDELADKELNELIRSNKDRV